MARSGVSLDDKYDLVEGAVFFYRHAGGRPARADAAARDRRMGEATAGYITGYRGSPLGGLDQQFWRAAKLLEPADILFQPGVNEDLAATALWGSQQAEMRGEGRYDGVFGIWYGKGPGVDRSGDAFKHANLAGTSPHGGVLALMGDDHTCESSTTAHQSEFAFVDAMIPILIAGRRPGDPRLRADRLRAVALSPGCWVGLKCVKDTVEVDRDHRRLARPHGDVIPGDFRMPPGGLNIRAGDTPLAQEERLHELEDSRRRSPSSAPTCSTGSMLAGGRSPRLGIVSAGKSYLDVLAGARRARHRRGARRRLRHPAPQGRAAPGRSSRRASATSPNGWRRSSSSRRSAA